MVGPCRWICWGWTVSTPPPLPTAHCSECWSAVPGHGGLGREGVRHLWAWRDEWGSSQGCSHCWMHWGDCRGKLGSFCLALQVSLIHSFLPRPACFPSSPLLFILSFPTPIPFHSSHTPLQPSPPWVLSPAPSPPPQSLALPPWMDLYGYTCVLLAQCPPLSIFYAC